MTKWTEFCLECKAEHNEICESKDCYELNYDPWGDPYPSLVFAPDYDGREEHIKWKRKQMEAQGK